MMLLQVVAVAGSHVAPPIVLTREFGEGERCPLALIAMDGRPGSASKKGRVDRMEPHRYMVSRHRNINLLPRDIGFASSATTSSRLRIRRC